MLAEIDKMAEIEILLKPIPFLIPRDFVAREQRLVRALQAAMDQRDRHFEWHSGAQAHIKKALANQEIVLFLKGVIQ